jgi:hypothetical protein
LQTGKETAAQLTQQEKAVASFDLIVERAGVAVGDLSRTQNSAANQAKRYKAEFKDITETFATDLMPVLSAMLPIVGQIVEKFGEWATKAAGVVQVLGDMAGLTDPVLRAELGALAQMPGTLLSAKQAQLERDIERARNMFSASEMAKEVAITSARLGIVTPELAIQQWKEAERQAKLYGDEMVRLQAVQVAVENRLRGRGAGVGGGGGVGKFGAAYEVGAIGVSTLGQPWSAKATAAEIIERHRPDWEKVFEALRVQKAAQEFQRASDITVAAFGEMVAAAKWGSRSMVEYFVQGLGEILKALSKGKTGGAWGFVAGAGEAFASFQHGGVVPGMPGTAVPIIAHAGETVVPRGGAPVNVYQTINFNVAALDAVGVQEVLRRNKGAVAQVVAEAAQEAPGFARALRGV